MNAKLPFQFRILHYVHDSFTGEFLNVGLAFYSQSSSFFRVRLLHKYSRITSTFPSADGEHYRKYIISLQSKFDALADSINTRQLSLEPWLPKLIDELLVNILPPDDSAIQFGSPQGGMALDLDSVFNDLYYRLVETYIPSDEHLSRDENEIWSIYSKPLHVHRVAGLLSTTVIHTPQDDIELDHAWKNGKWNCLQPISFDLQQTGSIQRKARLWLGTSVLLNESPDVGHVYYLLGKPQRDDTTLQKAYSNAVDLLSLVRHAKKITIIQEDEADDFARDISPQIQSDTGH